MENITSKILLSFLILSIGAKASEPNFEETVPVDRQPKVSGRIVKLYSGVHPEPVYCTREGFQVDPVHCATFYRCVRGGSGKYTVFKFQCGPGTIYDPEVETCNHPQRTRRLECGGLDKIHTEVPLIAPIAPSSSVLPPEIPSPIALKPVYSEPTKDTTTITTWATSIPDASSKYPWNTNPPKSYPSKLPSKPNRQGGDECTKDGFMGDSEDCRKFYRCVGNQRGGFIRYEFTCSEPTVWDEDAQSCNHLWAVQRSRCGRNINKIESNPETNASKLSQDNSEKDTSNTIQQQLQINYGNRITQTQTQISHGPVIQNQTQINYGDSKKEGKTEKNKQNQAQISYGSAVSQSQTQINHGDNAVQTQLQIDHSKDSSQAQTTTVHEENLEQGYNQPNQINNQNSESTSSENPGAIGANGNECKESGFMGDKHDCKKFYRCVDNGRGGFMKYEFSCGEGTVWDSSIESCNHAWAVTNCSSDGSQNNLEELQLTTKKPIENSQAIVESTTDDEDAGYGQLNQEQESSPTSTTTKTSKGPLSTTTTTTKRPKEENENSMNNECKSSGFMGDPNNCKIFYRCVDNGNGGYIRYEFSCGEGTVWDPKIEACNHAWAVEKCGQDNSDVYKDTTTSIKPTTTALYDEEVDTNPTTESGYNYPKPSETSTESSKGPTTASTLTSTQKSEAVCTQEGFMGDETDCKKFYRCVDDGRGGFIKYEFSCGDGTVWDSSINTCNHENSNNKSCNSNTSLQQENKPEATEKSTTSYETQTTSVPLVSTESITTSKPNSSNKCSQEGFMSDDYDCKKFFRCVDNGNGGYTKYDFTCGDGTVWDQEIQACNRESNNSNCLQNYETSTSSISNETSESSSASSSTINPTNTQKPNESREKCSAEGFFANSENCKRFYRCVDNGKGGFANYDFACGEGTVWVQEIQACDHDNGDICSNTSSDFSSNPPPSPEDTSEEKPTSPLHTESSSGLPDKQSDENPDDISKPPSSDDKESDCKEEGFYPNKNDCKKFYRCVDNGNGGFTKYDFDCGEGTAWDSDAQTCNHISEVKTCNENENQSQSKPSNDEQSSLDSNSQTSTTEKSKPNNKDICKEEGYFGNSEDCTKFYRCVDNGKGGFTKYDFQCGEGTIWDQDVTTCNHPQDVANPSCKQSADSETSNSESTSSTSTTPSSKPASTSSSNENNTNSDCSTKTPSKNHINCTKAGYYSDPNDCKKFYRCVDWDGNGEKFSVYHFECGEGTIWDPALDTCNHEDSVYPPRDCSGSESQNENVSEQTTTSESMTTENSTELSTTDSTISNDSTTQSNEQTTTQQSTDGATTTENEPSEQTSTQQTTEAATSENTSTQQTTTQSNEEQTTEQSSTTVQQTTTEQTTDQSTSSETTTQQTTIQESTTSDSSTQSMSEQSTTEQSTTEQSTTEQTITEHSTTEQSTTEHSTTEQSTTEHSTTEQSTTEQSSTNQTDEGENTETSTTESSQESTTDNSSESTTESSSYEKECPETEDDQNMFVCPTSFRRHPKFCNMFYQCTEDDETHDVQIATFHCPNNTIYDENQTKCVEEKKAQKKCDREMAQKRRLKRFDVVYKEPIIVTSERLKCPAFGHYPFEKSECSPAFLKCQKTGTGKVRGYVYQCPQNYVYWSVSRRCEPKGHLRDCKKSYNDWNGRWEIPVERRNVAP